MTHETKTPEKRAAIKITLGVGFLFLLFALYLGHLFTVLNRAFKNEDHFIPTRLYSDLTLIKPPLTRTQIESRLKALGYTAQLTAGEETQLQFTLHAIEYPQELLPAEHPTLKANQKQIRLFFDGPSVTHSLQKIEVQSEGDWDEIPEFYLEPELISTLSRTDQNAKREIRRVLKFDEITPAIWQAIIAVEDPRFLEHKGLDPRGIARALWVNLRSARLKQGGSTITAQLVKNLMARRSRNIFLKFNELFLAILLEFKYSKEEILERYLNEVYLGQVGSYEVHGVAEGAELFFAKSLEELNTGEIALMAGLIRGPGYYSPYRNFERAKDRQKFVLKRMAESGFLAPQEATLAEKQTIRLAPPMTVANKAPYFTDYVKAELINKLHDKLSEEDIASKGFRVYTTLDSELSSIAQRSISNGVDALEKKLGVDPAAAERLEGALASVDHRTGFIRVLVGGRSYSQNTFNRILNMKRQVGSTFKPLVYLTAFHHGETSQGIAYGTGTPVEDAPWTLIYDRGKQKWSPRNYDTGYLGWVPLRTALAKSINTVAAKVGYDVGIPKIIETAQILGIKSDLPNVPSLTLGVAELSPVELLTAYSIIANHGVQDELTVIRAIVEDNGHVLARYVYNPSEVFPRGPIDLLIEAMQGTFVEGTAMHAAKASGFVNAAAGKTGTTSSYRDSWFAGFTPHLTTVVWVGTDQNTSLTTKETETDTKKKKKSKKIEITGASGALPIWIDYVKQAERGLPTIPFEDSDELSDVRIDERSGHPATLDCPDSQTRVEKYWSEHRPHDPDCKEDWPQSIRETRE